MFVSYICFYFPLVLWYSFLLPYYFFILVIKTYLYCRIRNKGPALRKSHLHHTDARAVLNSEWDKIQEGLLLIPIECQQTKFNCIYQRKPDFHAPRHAVNTLVLQENFIYRQKNCELYPPSKLQYFNKLFSKPLLVDIPKILYAHLHSLNYKAVKTQVTHELQSSERD